MIIDLIVVQYFHTFSQYHIKVVKMTKSLIYILSFLVLFSCAQKEQKQKIIPPALFASLYVDLLLQQEWHASSLDSLHSTASWKDILKKHTISESELTKTIQYYENNPDLWVTMFDAVVQELETREQQISNAEQEKPADKK